MEKHTFGEKFRALMATGRVANLPTVWSNVLIGLGAVYLTFNASDNGTQTQSYDLIFTATLIIATSMLYLGGCILGDYKDIEYDKKNRPNRPLPLGILSLSFAASSAYILLIAGLLTSWLASPLSYAITQQASSLNKVQLGLALLLTSCITIYALTHKKTGPYALINMALCRFLLVATASSTLFVIGKTSYSFQPFVTIALILAGTIGTYTFLLSSVASTESTPRHYQYRKALSIALLALPFLSLITRHLLDLANVTDLPHISLTIVAVTIYILWSSFALGALNTSKPDFVSRALAGFCLIDMCFAATFSAPLTITCFVLFCLALLLQKIAPAT